MAKSIFNRYLNKNIFEKYLDLNTVYRDLYISLVECINGTEIEKGSAKNKIMNKDLLSNYLFLVKHLILNNANVNTYTISSEQLIKSLNLDGIEKDANFIFSSSHVLFNSGIKSPKWSDDFLKIFSKVIIPNWGKSEQNHIKTLSQSDEIELRELVKNYLLFNSDLDMSEKDNVFIDILVNFYKKVILDTNPIRTENKYNFRQFVPIIAAEFTVNWKNLRELV